VQKWEYLTVYIHRASDWLQGEKSSYATGTDWRVKIQSSKGAEVWAGSHESLIDWLGERGWELVSVSPRSDYLGGMSFISGNSLLLDGSGRVSTKGEIRDFAGWTSCEVWAFKRPKE
jgi:hypothetical protein